MYSNKQFILAAMLNNVFKIVNSWIAVFIYILQ